MSFNDLRDRPVQKNYGLRSDWTTEERRFKSGLPDFLKVIKEFSTSSDKPVYSFDPEKIINSEVVINKEVTKQEEIIKRITQDETNHSVESINVQAANAGLALQPAQQEPDLSIKEIDPFDDVSESNNPSDDPFEIAPTVKKPVVAPLVSAAKTSALTDEDIFGESISQKPSTPAPAANPITPQPPLVAITKLSVETPAAESAQPVKPSLDNVIASCASYADPATGKPSLYPVVDSEGAALADSFLKLKHCASMTGFDFESFQEVIETANEMLAGLPEVDLDTLENHLGEYSVNLDLDYLRANPHVLSDRLLEIQAKRDAMFVATLRLTPLISTMKSAYNYYMDAGIGCSTESSQPKRLAQIMKAIPKFLVRYAKVNRTKESVEHTFNHLEGQYECISRLITVYQINNKVGDISRGALPYVRKEEVREEVQDEVPFDPPYKTTSIPAPKIKPAPEKEAPTGKAPTITADDDFVNRSMSQPANGKKFENLESFVSGTKPAKKTTNSNGATSEVEW